PTVVTPIADQQYSGAGEWHFAVPAGTFAAVDGDGLALSAMLGDGSALPSWLSFDAATGTFSGNPPNGVGSLTLHVTA
ncbi:putative Ig domain-containing protein, partial [Klebsiella pneumoniae]|uniref:putative Ig domain-containing protein n=1 Tax=Klebsiella pneumoniae TaxID=573 RepID=UPI0022B63FA4